MVTVKRFHPQSCDSKRMGISEFSVRVEQHFRRVTHSLYKSEIKFFNVHRAQSRQSRFGRCRANKQLNTLPSRTKFEFYTPAEG